MKAFLERFFKLSENKTTIRTEFAAGLTTFSTMAYILVVNPQILSVAGMDFGAVMVATIISTVIGTLCMGLFANYPFALAPGMGLNAYFTYGIVLGVGATWEIALGTCFIASLTFFVLNAMGIRTKIMNAIPPSLRLATVGGIGLFLAFIGFKNVKLIESHKETLVTLGKVTEPEIALTALGIIVVTALMNRGIKSAIILSILLNWSLGLVFGLVKWQGLLALPPSLSPTLLKLDIIGALNPLYIPVILSFVFVAIFDTAGTLFGLAEQGHFTDKEGHIPRANKAQVNDAIGTAVGALVGTSPLTTYLESASGVAAGGRTGLTALFVALFFLLSLFISPFAASVPHFATAPVLIVIGAMMLKEMTRLPWDEPSEYIPAFIVLITIPLTFSIATGIALGFITYPLIKLLSGKVRDVGSLVWGIAALFILRFFYI